MIAEIGPRSAGPVLSVTGVVLHTSITKAALGALLYLGAVISLSLEFFQVALDTTLA
jgi:hypothetical protein